ncbi:MAG: response regulator [Xanthomonadales bacterium]|nr:response regulator [Xanthomonadales bacterium]
MNVTASQSILLVDDDPIVLEVLSAQLRALGHTVTTAASAAAAIAAALGARFDQILLDQNLAGEDGSSLLSSLREIAGTRQARAIAISAELDDARQRQLRQCGFAVALAKPITAGSLQLALAGDLPPATEPAGTSALDDAAALAIWGSPETVRSLRGILLGELPVYREMLQTAAASHDEVRLRDALHRMKSSAGFCGAKPLQTFIQATPRDATDWNALLQRYDDACAALKPDLLAALAT